MNLARKHDVVETEYATRGAHARAHAKPQLRLVAPLRAEVASRGVFALIVGGLLSIGLVGMLLINTSLAQGAFVVSALKAERAQLSEQESALNEEVTALSAPNALEQKARGLGMVPSSSPAFLSLADGSVLGKPKAAPVAPGAAAPRIATPADATAAEGVDSGLADLPAPLPADYDPAAADAAANGKGAKASGEDSMWTEIPVDTSGTGDAGLSMEIVD